MKKIILLTFLLLSLLFQENIYAAELEYKGDISFEHWGFRDEAAGSNQTDYNNTLEMKFESILKINFFSMLLAPRYKEDFQVPSRNRLLFDEAWIDLTHAVIEFRAGIQQFTWGMVESQKLVDKYEIGGFAAY